MHKQLLLISFLVFTFSTKANNLQIGPVTESVAGTDHFLNFTISWEHSWRMTSNPGNWDAVWTFVKRRDCAGGQWSHVNLSSADADHTAGTPLFVDAYSDQKAVMIYRSVVGNGNINSIAIQLKLNAPPSGNWEYKVSGIEMVYINSGSFYLGDGVSPLHFKIGASDDPYLITGETLVTFGPNAPYLWTQSISSGYNLAPSYPKGFNAFYMMKYEISQGQYAAFLNSITQDAMFNRYDATKNGTFRYTIGGTWPLLSADAPDRACNWLSIDDLAAYLDWAALSPFTELEFEKACRGDMSNSPVAGEFAWGGNQITDANNITPGTDGLPNETVNDVIVTGTGLANYSSFGVPGPLRCGFAAGTATTRFEAGASYYGVMELSGNVSELCINADSSQFGGGYIFTGTHGDGELSVTPLAGFADAGWPGVPFLAYAARGGAWVSGNNADQLKVSDRNAFIINTSVPNPDANGRSFSFGGRGVSRRQ